MRWDPHPGLQPATHPGRVLYAATDVDTSLAWQRASWRRSIGPILAPSPRIEGSPRYGLALKRSHTATVAPIPLRADTPFAVTVTIRSPHTISEPRPDLKMKTSSTA